MYVCLQGVPGLPLSCVCSTCLPRHCYTHSRHHVSACAVRAHACDLAQRLSPCADVLVQAMQPLLDFAGSLAVMCVTVLCLAHAPTCQHAARKHFGTLSLTASCDFTSRPLLDMQHAWL